MKRDERGFAEYGEFKHSYGGTVRVKQSSSALGRYIWLFIDNSESPAFRSANSAGSAHLSISQAKRLIKILQKATEAVTSDKETR